MYRKFVLAVFASCLMCIVACSGGNTAPAKKHDISKIVTKEAYEKADEKCSSARTGAESANCLGKIFMPAIEKYCADKKLSPKECEDFRTDYYLIMTDYTKEKIKRMDEVIEFGNKLQRK